jgi:hypothetical protein
MNSASENRVLVRLVPEEPFPPYTFVPGVSPHPTADPAGHSFGSNPPLPAALDPQRWEASKPYLYGIDLFNAGYFWESHVAWEGLWLACGRRGPTAGFLKGLIKLAAAGVKHREGKPRGVKSHSCRAAELWREVARALRSEEAVFLGFRLSALIGLADAACQRGWPEESLTLRPALGEPTAGRMRQEDGDPKSG